MRTPRRSPVAFLVVSTWLWACSSSEPREVIARVDAGAPSTTGSAVGTTGATSAGSTTGDVGTGGETGMTGGGTASTSTSGGAGAATGTGAGAGAASGDAGGTGTSAGGATGSETTGGATTGTTTTGGVDAGEGDAGSAADGGAGDPAPTAGTSTELFESLSLGINLGNSLDVPDGETNWGNPPVSRALVQAIADAGFQLVRIPVTWTQHTGPGPAYTVDAGWLARVEEVVGYVLDAGMIAVINVHHDGADGFDGAEWISLNPPGGGVSDAHDAQVRARFVTLWTQIAAHFADHDTRLIFESMNEIHDGYDAPDPRYYATINQLNQAFVDTVRESGGNNATRHLVVPGYNTNIDYTLEGFELPRDPTPDHLILSVHFYDPWSYAGAAETNTWGSGSPGSDGWGQEDHVRTQFDRLHATYASQGVPVFIGEYGAVQQAGHENYRRYYMEYVTAAASLRGLLPVYWDNGGEGSGPDAFGLFDRDTGAVLHPAILEAMQRAVSGQGLDAIARP